MATVVDETLRPTAVEIYEAIRQAWVTHEMAPTARELQVATGYSSTTVATVCNILERKGHITRQKFKERSVRPVDLARKLSNKPVAPWDEDLDTPQIWL